MKWLQTLGVILLSGLLVAPVLAQDEEEVEEDAPVASNYIDLKPPFTVNYGGVGRLRYLKTEISLRVAGGMEGQGAIRHHMPYIRHTIVMTLSKASDEDLSSMEGRELLRQNVLEAIREVLITEEGKEHVLDLLFNSFVVQSH